MIILSVAGKSLTAGKVAIIGPDQSRNSVATREYGGLEYARLSEIERSFDGQTTLTAAQASFFVAADISGHGRVVLQLPRPVIAIGGQLYLPVYSFFNSLRIASGIDINISKNLIKIKIHEEAAPGLPPIAGEYTNRKDAPTARAASEGSPFRDAFIRVGGHLTRAMDILRPVRIDKNGREAAAERPESSPDEVHQPPSTEVPGNAYRIPKGLIRSELETGRRK